MTFIIDENITPEAAELFRELGLKAWHINEMKSHKKQRVIDDQLRMLSIQKGHIIVTKDDDFVRSFVHRKVPEKLVFIHNLDHKEILLKRLSEIATDLPALLSNHDFIEINPLEIRFPFSD